MAEECVLGRPLELVRRQEGLASRSRRLGENENVCDRLTKEMLALLTRRMLRYLSLAPEHCVARGVVKLYLDGDNKVDPCTPVSHELISKGLA